MVECRVGPDARTPFQGLITLRVLQPWTPPLPSTITVITTLGTSKEWCYSLKTHHS